MLNYVHTGKLVFTNFFGKKGVEKCYFGAGMAACLRNCG